MDTDEETHCYTGKHLTKKVYPARLLENFALPTVIRVNPCPSVVSIESFR